MNQATSKQTNKQNYEQANNHPATTKQTIKQEETGKKEEKNF